MTDIPETTIDELLARYEVVLLDAYGVLVTSGGALPGAGDLIARLNHEQRRYFVITNDASKLPETSAARYRGYGLDLSPERIITSGSLLARYFAAHALTGARCVVLGPGDSQRYVEQAGGRIVPPSDGFDVLVVGDESGYPFLETVDQVLTSLFLALDRGAAIRLVLPNPDLIYPAGERGFGFASGTVAAMFEAALQVRYPDRGDLRFARLGKPHPAIFEEALRRSGTRTMVMIGDQLETDIRGACAFGIHSALVETGVTHTSVESLPAETRPTYRLRSLR